MSESVDCAFELQIMKVTGIDTNPEKRILNITKLDFLINERSLSKRQIEAKDKL